MVQMRRLNKLNKRAVPSGTEPASVLIGSSKASWFAHLFLPQITRFTEKRCRNVRGSEQYNAQLFTK